VTSRSHQLGAEAATIRLQAVHGTQTGWRQHQRAGQTPCGECDAGHAYYLADMAARRARMPIRNHGKGSGYRYYGCRCGPCVVAGSRAHRKARAL
jgi:hypothetical protein